MKERKLRIILALSVNLAIVPLLVGMSILQFFIIRDSINKRYEELRAQTERSIFDSYRIVNKSYQVIAKLLDDRLETAFKIFVAEYKKAGNLENLDLDRVRKKIGQEFDLYVIDDKNIIVKTTYPLDLGLDFNTYEEMAARLTSIRLGSTYAGDILVHETRSGRLRKYGYMPSPDHAYILELGLVSTPVASLIDEYNPYSLSTTLKTVNPNLLAIEIFKPEGTFEFYPEIVVPPQIAEKVQQAYRERRTIEERNPSMKTITKYLFQFIENPENPTQSQRIIQIVYSTKEEVNTLKAMGISLALVLALVILLVILTSFWLAKLVSKPVEQASSSLRRLADGYFDIPKPGSMPVYEMNLVLRDIQKLADSLTTMKEQAEESAKIKSQFLSSVTHELRTPLNSIINFSILTSLDPQVAKNPENTDMLLKIEESGKHLLKLIDDILDFEKTCSGEMKYNFESVDLGGMLPGMLASLSEMIGEKPVEIRTNIENWLPHVRADRKALRRIFLDLFRNAAKFTEQGYIAVGVSRHNQHEILVSVSDTGIGMTKEESSKIFEEFFTVDSGLDRVKHGLGLGLPICKQMVEDLGGKIWVESKQGEGSSFYFTLNRAD